MAMHFKNFKLMGDHSIVVKPLSTSAVYTVRHPVLRPGKPYDSCLFDGDELHTTKHFGVFSANELAGVASLFLKKTDLFACDHQYQLRGMAILAHQQQKGLGKILLTAIENFARNEEADLIWFNARLVAVPFYKSCGYDLIGDAFDIGDIGKHFVMFKKL